MIPTVTIDARGALAKFSPAGIPESVRKNLRQIIPDLTKRLGARVDDKLDTQLKSRVHLKVKNEMVENPQKIVGRVSVMWTGNPKANMVPAVLNTGSVAHLIEAKAGSALFFFWERMGKNVMFRAVHHPGFAGIRYMENSLAEMGAEIESSLRASVLDGARSA